MFVQAWGRSFGQLDHMHWHRLGHSARVGWEWEMSSTSENELGKERWIWIAWYFDVFCVFWLLRHNNRPYRRVSSEVPIKPYVGLCRAHVGGMLGVCWAHVGSMFGRAGPMLGHVGPMLHPYWACMGPIVRHVGPMLGHVEPKFGNLADFRHL